MDEDQQAATQAQYDQLSAAMRPVADSVALYMHELRAKGVTKAEALELARDYQARLFDGLGLGLR